MRALCRTVVKWGTLKATEKVKILVVLAIKSRKKTKQDRSWMLSTGASHRPFNTFANVLSYYRLAVSQMLCSGGLNHAAPLGWKHEDMLITLSNKLACRGKAQNLRIHALSLFCGGWDSLEDPPQPPPCVCVCRK